MAGCLLRSFTACKENDFLKPSQLFLYITVYSRASTKRFFLNRFPLQNSLRVATCNVVYILLPPFHFNHLATLSFGTDNNRRWVFTLFLKPLDWDWCTHSASPFYFFKRAYLLSGVFLRHRFCLLHSITVDLQDSLTISASPYLLCIFI